MPEFDVVGAGVKGDRKPAFDNLLAAGAILSGANYIFDGTGSGAALANGMRAGQKVQNI
jgi:anaerobic glycerol-3-phosphate dehydrogenase